MNSPKISGLVLGSKGTHTLDFWSLTLVSRRQTLAGMAHSDKDCDGYSDRGGIKQPRPMKLRKASSQKRLC